MNVNFLIIETQKFATEINNIINYEKNVLINIKDAFGHKDTPLAWANVTNTTLATVTSKKRGNCELLRANFHQYNKYYDCV